MYLLWALLFLHVSAQRLTVFDDRLKQPKQEGRVRLVGDLPSSGRVEVYHDGQWGTVCDDGWELAEAQVVCRQLGFPGAISVTPGGQYGEGSGPIWLDDMNCKGSESSLSDCSFKGWGVTDCSHKEDAGVVCETGTNITSNRQFFLDNSLGLSDDLGLLFDSGDGCDFRINIDVSITSAQCVHQLAFIFGVKKLMEDVGRAFSLLLPEDNTFRTQVSMYEYGVRTGDLVLQENVLQYLSWNCEFLISSPVWSTISFHMMDALLRRSDLVVNDEAFLLEGLETWIQDKGDEISSDQQASLLNHIRFLLIPVDKLYEMQFSSSVLRQNHEKLYLTGLLRGFQFNALPFSKIRNQMDNMSNGESKPKRESRVRLVGDLPSSGRVEVYHDGQWGTVCDDGWELAEAQVVCRQLGFPGAISVKPGGQYGEGSGPIWLDDMNCKGSESSLSDCSFKGWGVTDCSHKEDAGVVCETGKNISSNRQFSVDNSLGLSDDLGLLFDNGNGCDFRINIQDVNEESELTFRVHRTILMIYPELNIKNDSRNLTVNVSQTCHPHVSAFLRYL
ncbi:hypothetical protein cypCar_00005345, partial [Cyprinus carpio]